MTVKQNFERMAHYNQWMNNNLYKACALLETDELVKDRGAYFGSIIGTLNHIQVQLLISHWE